MNRLTTLFLFTTIIFSQETFARDFYVPKEITCDNNKLCYFKDTQKLFEGELVTFDLNGKKYSSIQYNNGLKHGAQKFYYDDGNISSLEYFSKGTLNGHARSFYQTGKIKEELEYENGFKQGPHRKFYEDGTLQEENNYVDSKKQGRSRFYDKNNKLIKEIWYENDTPVQTYCYSNKKNKTSCN